MQLPGTFGSGGGGGSGTVTTVSVATANGVSGSVANPTTTPAITLTLGAITPTNVNGLTISTSTGTLTVANAKTFTVNNTLTLAGTDGSTLNIGAGGTLGSNAFTSAAFANAALSNLASVSINASLIPQTTLDLGAAATAWRNLYLYGSGTFGTTSIQLTGTPTGNRVVTYPDSSTSIAIASQTLTFTGMTAARTLTVPDASFSLARIDAAQTFTGVQTFSTAIAVGSGGTGAATFTANGVLYGNTASALQVTAQGAANSILTANAGAPSFSQTPTVNTSLQIGVASSQTGSLILAGSGGANTHTFQAAANPAAANTYVWPAASPTANQVLAASAPSGGVVTLSWSTPAAAGANTTLSNLGTTAINAPLIFATGGGNVNQIQGPTDQPFQQIAQAPAVVATSTAGNAFTITASNATAGNVTAGAAAGGNVTITAGNAARLTSGNANGGAINLNPGSGIGTGVSGNVVLGSGALVLPAASQPALTFSGDTTTGLFHEAASAVGILLGGASKVYITAALFQISSGAQFSWSGNTSADGTNPDTAFARNAAGIVEVNSGTIGTFRDLQLRNLKASALITQYNNIATAGGGVPAVYGFARSTAQTAAVASVATYTVGAADGSFEVSANVLVTTSTTHAFTVTCAYTDEGNTSRTITFTFSNVGGTLLTSIANTGGAVPYEGVPLHIRCKASTTITIATTGTFTSVTYNVEGIIKQMA